ncbi:MAG TPA: hypothetical protein VNC50_19705, partial [Planctomycetia bacterium]|nr:hypothetical protein [Planctomycetia bacterium]
FEEAAVTHSPPLPHLRRLLAGALGVAALVAALAILRRGSAQAVVAGQSIATLLAAALGLVIAAIAAYVAALSAEKWAPWKAVWERVLASPSASLGRLPFAIAVALAFAVQWSIGDRLADANAVPLADQFDYLRVADEIAAAPGGAPSLPGDLLAGRHREDNRHPLYPALLASRRSIADRGDPFSSFREGKAISLRFALATTLLASLFATWRFGRAAGAFTALLLSLNFSLHHSGAIVACETLLAFLCLAAWWMFGSDKPKAPLGYLAVGALFGLAYLAKASAAFLFFWAFAWTLIQPRNPRRFTLALALVVGFSAVSFPLLVRNVRVYGSPFHSFNNKLLFADSFEKGIAEPDLGLAGNWQRFKERHTWKEIAVDRFGAGVVWESFVLLRSLGPIPFDSARAVFGLLALGLAAIGFASWRGVGLAPALLLPWTGFFLLFFGWYQPIAAGDRFLLPLVPPLLVAAAVGLCQVVSTSRLGPQIALGSLVLANLAAAWVIFSGAVDPASFFTAP